MVSGGGGSALRFTSGAYRYVVYSVIGKSGGAKAGVGVWRGDKQVSHIRCRDGKAEVDAPRLEKAGLAYANDPFDLPE